jgi:hypothetical protein
MMQLKGYALAAAGVVLLGTTIGIVTPLVQSRGALAAMTPRDPDAGQPFAAAVGVAFSPGELVKSRSVLIPGDKRAVIETVAVFAGTGQGDMRVGIVTTAPALGGRTVVTTQYNLHLEFEGVIAQLRRFGGTHGIRLYANPGSTVQFVAARTNASGIGSVSFAVAGYLLAP